VHPQRVTDTATFREIMNPSNCSEIDLDALRMEAGIFMDVLFAGDSSGLFA
jgi:hypothetical protein